MLIKFLATNSYHLRTERYGYTYTNSPARIFEFLNKNEWALSIVIDFLVSSLTYDVVAQVSSKTDLRPTLTDAVASWARGAARETKPSTEQGIWHWIFQEAIHQKEYFLEGRWRSS